MKGLQLGFNERHPQTVQLPRSGPARGTGKAREWLRGHPGFALIVMLPTVLAALYFMLVATPQYVSVAEFVVRGPNSSSPGMLSSLFQSVGSGGASQDTYAVQDYMMSRDAAQKLVMQQNLMAVYTRQGADFLARFPRFFFPNRTFEGFYRYYKSHVTAELDTTSGLSTLSVITFSASDSQRIAQALMSSAEQLVNAMNERQRSNMIASANGEVTAAEQKISAVGARLADYRNRVALIDPLKQSAPMLQDINQLQTMLTNARLQLTQLRQSAPSSPLIGVYQRRAAALETEIEHSNARVTGGDASLVPKITEYDQLTIQREVAERELTAATIALQQAKAQADRQQLYLDEVTYPNLPDYAAYPRGLVDTLIVFATTFALYLMGVLLIASAREHRSV